MRAYTVVLLAALGYQAEVTAGFSLLLLVIVAVCAFRYDKIAKQLRR